MYGSCVIYYSSSRNILISHKGINSTFQEAGDKRVLEILHRKSPSDETKLSLVVILASELMKEKLDCVMPPLSVLVTLGLAAASYQFGSDGGLNQRRFIAGPPVECHEPSGGALNVLVM
jgi:hypothetical protein